jgi:hypothetical protein
MSNRRVTVELSPKSQIEFDRLQQRTGLSTSDLLRYSVTLMRIYFDSRTEGKEVRIVNPKDPQDQVRLELPIPVESVASPRKSKAKAVETSR